MTEGEAALRTSRRRRCGGSVILFALSLSWGCGSFAQDPIGMTVVALTFSSEMIGCAIFSCDPVAPEGMTLEPVTETYEDGPLVAIDVDAFGRIYATLSGRMENAVLDNRGFDESELDEELAIASVEDRVAMIDRLVERGQYEAHVFTDTSDRVVVFDDRTNDGSFETRSDAGSFSAPASGIASGVLVLQDEVLVTNVPDVWRFSKLDGDGLPAHQERLSTGWGARWAFYGHDLHGLVQGPDGKIYFSIGDRGFRVETSDGGTLEPDLDVGRGAVLRMNPDGTDLEIFAQGLRNPQELAFDDYGNLFTGDNNSDSADEARLVYVAEGGDSGWMMPYQLLRSEEYERGPWNAESLWRLQHDGQPAWVLPPIAHLTNGPAGFVHAPGLGLPDRWRGHFFLADYAYLPRRSAIVGFAVEPDGAGFRSTQPEPFVADVLATDMAFGLDGSLYIAWFQQFPGPYARLYRLSLDTAHAAEQAARLREMRALVRDGMGHRDAQELARLLGFEDRRVRMPAQFELARRGDAPTLGRVALNRSAPLLARLHALWGLGQIGAAGLEEIGLRDLDGFRGDDPEVRAQAARLVGAARADWLGRAVAAFLSDESARVRYFAAFSVGKVGAVEAVPDLVRVLRENEDRDVFLRHAVVVALSELAGAEPLERLAHDPSPSVRMGALLAMRRRETPAIAVFLDDPDPRLVVEAARAIYDVPIRGALPALAALGGASAAEGAADAEVDEALHRRVIHAAVALRSAAGAESLAAFAAAPGTPPDMRREALSALATYTTPPPRDAVLGRWSPREERPPEVVHVALDRHVPRLLGTPFEGRAIEVAAVYGRVPLADGELVARVEDEDESTSTRVASLRALGNRLGTVRSSDVDRAIGAGLASRDPELRSEARDLLAETDPTAAVARIGAIPDDAPAFERQRGIATLARLARDDADAKIARELGRLNAGTLPADVGLDVLEAARARQTKELTAGVARFEASLDPADPLAPYRVALYGGDAARGSEVFNGNGDCRRCHDVSGGHGGDTGPELTGLAARYDREEILRAILLPDATIASGFEQRGGGSAMPPIAVELPPRELRDLMAYLASLR